MCAKSYDEVNYCLRCAEHLIIVHRFGAERPCCPNCGWVYFADPKVAVAVLVVEAGRLLLVRRANDPQRGLWTLPAGFIDAGEEPELAAIRECQEETGLSVQITRLVDVIAGQEHPRGAHILIVYQARMISGEPNAGDDVDMVDFFAPETLPALAFTTTKKIAEQWVAGEY